MLTNNTGIGDWTDLCRCSSSSVNQWCSWWQILLSTSAYHPRILLANTLVRKMATPICSVLIGLLLTPILTLLMPHGNSLVVNTTYSVTKTKDAGQAIMPTTNHWSWQQCLPRPAMRENNRNFRVHDLMGPWGRWVFISFHYLRMHFLQ